MDAMIDAEFLGMVANFLVANKLANDPVVLGCFWAPFLMFRAEAEKERLSLVVILMDKILLLSCNPTKRDLGLFPSSKVLSPK